ncbi:MAG: hypothetical protein E6Q98_16075 [Rhodospirillaceae bacterium]|nr:MAG: hypothetical protein E6Q98_16075 [Rhodospirillaceae bacterium]
MTSVAYEIPLTAEPQKRVVTLVGQKYTLIVTWCDPQQYWVLELRDVNDVILVAGIPLVTGADLLAQYEYLEIGGALVAQSDADGFSPPTYENLGQTAHLYFIVG